MRYRWDSFSGNVYIIEYDIGAIKYPEMGYMTVLESDPKNEKALPLGRQRIMVLEEKELTPLEDPVTILKEML